MKLLPLLLAIVVIAFVTGSDSLFYLAYVVGGLLLVTHLWMRQGPRALQVERHFPARAFHGEEVQAELEVTNRGRWPILWLDVHESLPLALHVPNFERRIVSLAPGEKTRLQYRLSCQQRGYYELGPASLSTGDFFDLAPANGVTTSTHPFIVYPRVLPLRDLKLPSQLPFGDLPSQQRIFQDPSRFFGVREYQPGDSLRQINWKSSAHSERLLVKRFQPAIALNTHICLNLNTEDYDIHSWSSSSEMAIVVAASIAAHLIERRQRAGLALLGGDGPTKQAGLTVIPPDRGRGHLMRILETLARAEVVRTTPFVPTLNQASAKLGWGSSLVVITPGDSPHLIDALLQMRRRGFHVMLIATDPEKRFLDLHAQLEQIGIPAYRVTDDREMDVWR